MRFPGSWDNTLKVLDLGSERAIAIFAVDGLVLASVVASDGTIVAEKAASRMHLAKLQGRRIRD